MKKNRRKAYAITKKDIENGVVKIDCFEEPLYGINCNYLDASYTIEELIIPARSILY